MQGYHCRTCGQYHAGLPIRYGPAAPDMWFALPERERKRRALLSSDQCEIDDQWFFVVGNLEIPLTGSKEPFAWSVWVSLSRENYTRACDLWTTPGRETEPPYFGWLSTTLPSYPPTNSLKTNLHTRPVGQRPFVELEPTDHPLAVEQRTGITWERVQQIAEAILHPAQ